MSHRGEGKAVLVISHFSHNLSVSLSNYCSAKNPKLTQVEHACSIVCASLALLVDGFVQNYDLPEKRSNLTARCLKLILFLIGTILTESAVVVGKILTVI